MSRIFGEGSLLSPFPKFPKKIIMEFVSINDICKNQNISKNHIVDFIIKDKINAYISKEDVNLFPKTETKLTEYLTIKEVCSLYKVTRQTIYKYIEKENFPVIKFGSKKLFDSVLVKQWVENKK